MIKQIIDDLHTAADPQRKSRSIINFPTSMEVLGVTSPAMNNLIKVWWIDLKTYSPEKLIDLAKKLVETKIMEGNHVAFLLLWKNEEALRKLSLADLELLGQNIDNWATTDAFSIMLSGFAWRENQISDADVLKWLDSESRWWRRAAVVSTVTLNLRSRGGTGDVKRTLWICEKVISDRDDMIVKALSWALRELSKSDKKAVEDFMKKFENKVAGRVRREVYTKLETGRKNG